MIMKFFWGLVILSLILTLIHANGREQLWDEYGKRLPKAAEQELRKNMAAIKVALDGSVGDDALLKEIKGFKYIQETFTYMSQELINRLWWECQNIDKIFGFLKPKTLYFLFYNRLFTTYVNGRIHDFPKVWEKITNYYYGCMDAEGNWRNTQGTNQVTTNTTAAPETVVAATRKSEKGKTNSTSSTTTETVKSADGKIVNPYIHTTRTPLTTVSPALRESREQQYDDQDEDDGCCPTLPDDPGPFTEDIRLLIFKSMPDLHPNVVNTLSAFDWTFTEYVLHNAKDPSTILRSMHSDTLMWVTQHVRDFAEILAKLDEHTIYDFFSKVPYPCQYYLSLEKTTRDHLAFKYTWLHNCEPPSPPATNNRPTAAPQPQITTPQPEPLFDAELLEIVNMKVPNFGILLEIVPFEKFTSTNPKAVALMDLVRYMSHEDAKKADSLFRQLERDMTTEEAADVFRKGVKVFSGALTVSEFIMS